MHFNISVLIKLFVTAIYVETNQQIMETYTKFQTA